ncbi:MAG TPA: polyprenyl synthetase family protein, partial [Blastocatellia bacterium]|nr:polyprenyl synthetase family protein [Blastocatellia bacterium]
MKAFHFEKQMVEINDYFKANVRRVDKWLDRLLPAEQDPPDIIHEAMRYSVFAGGKRLRPILMIATGEIFGAPEDELLPTACALEMIHTYSLIHDDLPAMDNDTLRRGRPTNHVVYGEAMAILAGDALLTHAFRTLADCYSPDAERKVRVLSEVAQAAGTVRALIGGQVLDIQCEDKPVTGEQLEEIHHSKTGALFRCAVRIGGIIGCASE